MSGQQIQVDGGTYYVIQNGSLNRPIFSDSDDYAFFEELLAARLSRTNSCVHAFCWTPDTIHLVLQIGRVPVGRILQSLTVAYAKGLHRRTGKPGYFLRSRYKSALIDPKVYLLRLLRYVHYVPVLGGFAATPQTAEHTSYGAYFRRSDVPWLTTSIALRFLGDEQVTRDGGTFMDSCPAPEDVSLFGRVGQGDLRVIGAADDLEKLPREAAKPRPKPSLDDIIRTVTCRMGVDREVALSNSRLKEMALVRALIAWYAEERGVASVTEIAPRLGCKPSALSEAVRRQRSRHPELFRITAMHDIAPLGPLAAFEKQEAESQSG